MLSSTLSFSSPMLFCWIFSCFTASCPGTLSHLFHLAPPPPCLILPLLHSILFYCSHIYLFFPHLTMVFVLTSHLYGLLLVFRTLFLPFHLIGSLWISISPKSPNPHPASWPLLSSLLHYITLFHALFHLHAQPTTVYLRPLALPLFLFCPVVRPYEMN